MPLIIAAGVTIVAGLISGIGKKKAGDAASKSAAEQAALTRASTEMDVARIERAGFQAMGAIKAGAGGSGLKAKGSALDILRSSASNIALDMQLRRTGGEVTAKGYANQSKQAKIEGNVGMATSILGGASKALSGGAF